MNFQIISFLCKTWTCTLKIYIYPVCNAFYFLFKPKKKNLWSSLALAQHMYAWLCPIVTVCHSLNHDCVLSKLATNTTDSLCEWAAISRDISRLITKGIRVTLSIMKMAGVGRRTWRWVGYGVAKYALHATDQSCRDWPGTQKSSNCLRCFVIEPPGLGRFLWVYTCGMDIGLSRMSWSVNRGSHEYVHRALNMPNP